MAGEQPLQGRALPSADPQHLPGAFPETPGAVDDQKFSVNPIPGNSAVSNPIQLAPGAPVPESSTFDKNTISSNVHDDPALKAADAATAESSVGISPLPATGGISNPIQLTAGEPVPNSSEYTSSTLQSNVKLDKESYENSGTANNPSFPSAAEIGAGATAVGAGLLGGATMLGDKAKGLIPKSSMPMGEDTPASIANENVGPHISSVAPASTTTELAGRVPLEPRSRDTQATISSVGPTSSTNALAGAVPLETRGAPAVVSESQEKAGVDPEASAVPSAVEDKKEVESELQSKVPEAPATSESGLTTGNVVGMAAGGIAAAGAAAAGTASSFADRFFGAGVASGTDDWNAGTSSATTSAPDASAATPALVTESQDKANVDPEASANPTAVEEKSAVENELQSKVPEAPATSESGFTGGNVVGLAAGGVPAAGAAAAGTAYALKDRLFGTGETTNADGTSALTGVTAAPALVSESQEKANVDPEASANPAAVEDKKEVENELQSKVPEVPATSQPGTSEKTISEVAAGGVAAAGAAAAGTAYALKDKVIGASDTSTPSGSAAAPAIVTESQEKARVDPEASAIPSALGDKKAMESELQSKVQETPAIAEATAPSSMGVPNPLANAGVPASSSTGAASSTAASNPLANAGVPATSSTGPAWTGGAPPMTSATEAPKDVAAGEIPTTTSTDTPSVAGPATGPASGSSNDQKDGLVAGIAGGVAAAGAAAAGTAYALRDKTASATGRDPVSSLPQSVQDSINAMDKKVEANKPIASEGSTATAIGAAKPASSAAGASSAASGSVPDEVVASQKAAHVDPEASASPVMVGEKTAVERELLSKVPTAQGSGAPAPSGTAALSSTAPASSTTGAPQLGNPIADVKPLAMDGASATGTSTTGTSGLNASAATPAISAITAESKRPEVSRDVSPMTVPTTSSQAQPVVTTGVGSSTAPAQSGKPVGTPRKDVSENASPARRTSMMGRFKGTPESSKTTESTTPGSSSTDKKEKRKSFFGRLKEKMHKSDH
nr:hypothetical protein CFP56_21299 [Quercus suber]